MPKPAIVAIALVLAAVTGAAEAQRARPSETELWLLSASLRESYIDNLFLINGGPGDWVTNATVSLSYLRRRPPATFSANGWIGGNYFGRFDNFRSVNYGLGVSGNNQLDRRARARYSASFTDGLNRNTSFESRFGPEVDVKSGYASTGLDYAFTPSTTGRLSADLSGLHYRIDASDIASFLPTDLQTPPVIDDPDNPPDPDAPSLEDLRSLLEALALEGFLVRDIDYWTWHFGAGISHEFSPNTQASLDLGSRSTTSETVGVPHGQLFDASATLTQKIDPTASVSLGYVYTDADYGTSATSQTVFLRAQKEFDEKVHGDVTLGASQAEAQDTGSSPWNFVGGLGVSVQMKRGRFTVHANRSVYQGIILGRQQISDDVSASFSHVFNKRVFASAFASYRNAHDTTVDELSSEQIFGGATLSIRLSKRFRLSPSYAYAFYSRGPVLRPPGRSTFGLSLRYTKAFN